MITWLVLPVLLSALFGTCAPAVCRQLPPAIATWLLSGGAVVAAAACCVSLGLFALVCLGQLPAVGEQGRWSIVALRETVHLPGWAAAPACLAVTVVGARLVRAVRDRVRAVRGSYRMAARLSAGDDELVVLGSSARHAFAVPGRPARIVVTSGLLRTLDAVQRRALLSHERAHLDHRHHWHQSAVALAAAVNPLLWRLPAATGRTCERWADEAAATRCPREAIAAALTRAALGRAGQAVPAVVLPAAAADLVARISALEAPAPRVDRRRGLLLVAGAVLLVATAVAVAVATHDVERVFEHAQNLYRAHAR